MEVVSLRKNRLRATRNALRALREGRPFIFPTDTVYGIGGDALRPSVARRVLVLKRRSPRKPFPWLVADFAMAKRYVRFSAGAEAFARRVWPGAVTVVLPRRGSKRATQAVRIPDHAWLRRLIKRFGRPIIGTSANVGGKPPARTAREAAAAFESVDLIVGGGRCARAPSAVVDWTAVSPTVLRGSLPGLEE